MRFTNWLRGQTTRTDAVGAAAKAWFIEGRQPDPLLMKAAVGEFQQTFSATGDPVKRRLTDDDLIPQPVVPRRPHDPLLDQPIWKTVGNNEVQALDDLSREFNT